MPIKHEAPKVEIVKVADFKSKSKIGVFHTLRSVRTNSRYKGRRDKKAKDAEDAKK